MNISYFKTLLLFALFIPFIACEKDKEETPKTVAEQLQATLSSTNWVTTLVRNPTGAIIYKAAANGVVTNVVAGGFLPIAAHGNWGFGISNWSNTGEFTFFNMITPSNRRGGGTYSVSNDSIRTLTFTGGNPGETKIITLTKDLFIYRRADGNTVEHIPTQKSVSLNPFPTDAQIKGFMVKTNWITTVLKDTAGVVVYQINTDSTGVITKATGVVITTDATIATWGFGISNWTQADAFTFYRFDNSRRGGGNYTITSGVRGLVFGTNAPQLTEITDISDAIFTYVREDGRTVEHIPTKRPL